ncbi:MAG TPA: prolyl oligopeptidase family serine peptidase [Acidimicrobiales bacterium]|nr:prolyl oligopeptidase family serine peptidase [Acidimicrobiales bacterium]
MCAWGRVLSEPRLSPDGRWVAFVATSGGRGAVVVVPVGGGPERVVTSDPPAPAAASYGGGTFDWTPSSDALVYVGADRRLYLQPSIGGAPRLIVADGPVAAPAVSPDGTEVAYVRDARHVAVASLDPAGPWPRRLSSGSNDFAFDPAWSPDGRSVVWHEWDVPAMAWDDSRIMMADEDGKGDPVALPAGRAGAAAAVNQPRFSPAGPLAFLSDAQGWLNLWQAASDGRNGAPLLAEEAEHGEATWGPGQRSFAWSPDGRQVVLCRNEAGFGRLCVIDVATGAVRDLDRGVYRALSWAGDHVAGLRSGSRTPDQVVVLDPAIGKPSRRTIARGPVAGFEAAGLPEPEVVTWDGEDVPGLGTTVHGRLYRGQGGNGPLLVWIHGGPTGQHQVTFNARIAFYCTRGCRVLHVDHRGSTGWGRAYAQALRGQWGRLDVADTAAGMRAAVDRGWADPDRMVPIGSSAGGLTVLLLLATHPELCAAGVDLYGVTDLFDLDETTHRFEAHYLRSIVGELPAAASVYRERSPITQAGRIAAPLLVLQGTADNVVPRHQSDSLVAAVRSGGGTVEYHVYEGEGHGWNRPEVVEDELERTWGFLRRYVVRRR